VPGIKALKKGIKQVLVSLHKGGEQRERKRLVPSVGNPGKGEWGQNLRKEEKNKRGGGNIL